MSQDCVTVAYLSALTTVSAPKSQNRLCMSESRYGWLHRKLARAPVYSQPAGEIQGDSILPPGYVFEAARHVSHGYRVEYAAHLITGILRTLSFCASTPTAMLSHAARAQTRENMVEDDRYACQQRSPLVRKERGKECTVLSRVVC